MDDNSPHRRFQFRLRTLMIVVTLLAVPCAYVAHEANIVRKRREWLSGHPVRGNIGTLDSLGRFSLGDLTQQPSWFRIGTLGDSPRRWVIVPASAATAEKQAAAALFPEADILYGPSD
jgi:hypothetical protein